MGWDAGDDKFNSEGGGIGKRGREWAIKVWGLLVKQEVNSLTKVEKPHLNLLEMMQSGIDGSEPMKCIARITNAPAGFLRFGTATRTSLGPSKRGPTTTS